MSHWDFLIFLAYQVFAINVKKVPKPYIESQSAIRELQPCNPCASFVLERLWLPLEMLLLVLLHTPSQKCTDNGDGIFSTPALPRLCPSTFVPLCQFPKLTFVSLQQLLRWCRADAAAVVVPLGDKRQNYLPANGVVVSAAGDLNLGTSEPRVPGGLGGSAAGMSVSWGSLPACIRASCWQSTN